MDLLVTGSSGLIGSEAVVYFDRLGWRVDGIDNNMRRDFFGPAGDTTWNRMRLEEGCRDFTHHDIDIRDRQALERLFGDREFNAIIHCAAQPSHDRAGDMPLVDFEVNAVGTLNLLEVTRNKCPQAAIIVMSTNKVYGDAPNEVPLQELPTRWDYADQAFGGISETCRIDQSLHSLFGASKLAADIMAQEYGRYYGMNVGIFRGGCLTGAAHSAVELHGFLAYLVKVALTGTPYRIYGYKGKQVRDQIDSKDVVRLFDHYIQSPKAGEVYNLGGGRSNSLSIIEAIELVERVSGRRIKHSYVENARRGDHICYISDLTKIKRDFPNWHLSVGLTEMVEEMVDSTGSRVPRLLP